MLSVSRWTPHHYSVNGSFLRVRQGKQWDCPGGTSGKESCQLGDAGLILGWGNPLGQPTSILLPGKFHGQRSLVGYSSWGCKESDTAE